MVDKLLEAIQHDATILLGGGTVKIIKYGMGGYFVLDNGESKTPLGQSYEEAHATVRRMSGVDIRMAPVKPKVEWGERRGRPRKNG